MRLTIFSTAHSDLLFLVLEMSIQILCNFKKKIASKDLGCSFNLDTPKIETGRLPWSKASSKSEFLTDSGNRARSFLKQIKLFCYSSLCIVNIKLYFTREVSHWENICLPDAGAWVSSLEWHWLWVQGQGRFL